MKYSVGSLTIYPGHGLAQIKKIENRKILGKNICFYVLNIIDSGIKVMVPVSSSDDSLRPIITKEQCNKILTILGSPGLIVQTTWNRRQKNLCEKLKSQRIHHTAEVLRDLYLLDKYKEFSFGEKVLFEKAYKLLCGEIAASKNISLSEAQKLIDICLEQSYQLSTHVRKIVEINF